MTDGPLVLGVFLVSGVSAGLVVSRLGLPRVTAYVMTGVAFSQDLLGHWMGIRLGDWADPLTSVALGIVAYLIGGSITLPQLRRMGKTMLGSALGESLGAVALVFVGVFMLAPDVKGLTRLQAALAFAGIAATTAPAATVAVLHQYRAKGPVTTTLLGVVALDDALGIVVFSIVMVIAAGQSMFHSLEAALLAIGGALALGVAAAQLLTLLCRHVRDRTLLLPVVIGTVLLVVGLAQWIGASPLLSAMTLGFAARHSMGAGNKRILTPVETLEEFVFVVFFTLAGAHFRIDVFLGTALLASIYFFARVAGKLAGAAIGARVVGAPKNVVRWLGLGLVPQAGVAVGLALSLTQQPAFRQATGTILNVVLATTVLYEILGPLATRFGLAQAGELGPKRKRVSHESS